MLKRFYTIIIVTMFFLLNTLMMIPVSQTATADIEHWIDWVIDEDTTITGETIIAHGDVIVENGSSLTLDNCVLKIDSKIAGNNGIEVEAGGELYVYDTTITSNGELQYYYFTVYGKLMIDNADVSKMFFPGLEVSKTKDAIIKNSNVHNNPTAYGITFVNSTGTIIKNNIYKNLRGITVEGESIVTIVNNIITSNVQCGIVFFDNSKASINNNTISDNYGDRGRGIDTEDNSIVSVANNIITSNKQVGIHCSGDSKVNINNNTISDSYGDGGRGIGIQQNSIVTVANNIITSNEEMGVGCFHDSKVNINNNTISDSYGEEGRGINTIDNSTVSIANNIITSNREVGIFCSGNSEVNIDNNTVSDTYGGRERCGRGIAVRGDSIVSIVNNIINSNRDLGILCSEDSKVNINSNTILDTYGEIGRGIEIGDDSTVSIANNLITSNKQNGVCCGGNSKVDINNNTISKTEGGFRGAVAIYADNLCTVSINNNDIISNEKGLVVLDFANVKICNSSITNSIEYDIWIGNSSHPTIINTQFDLDKLFFNDTESIISIGHWVDVNVQNKNDVPVQNAEIAVMNKDGAEVFNGTSDYDGHCLASVVEYDLDYTFTKKFCTPHTVYASKLGKSDSEKITVDMHKIVNFTLDVSDKLAHGNLITQIVDGHEVTVEYRGNGTVTIEPASMPAEPPNATKDIGIFMEIIAVGDVEDLYITIRYSEDELGEGVNEADLRMYCYLGPGEYDPGEYDPGEYSPGEYGPGEYSPGEYGGWMLIKNSGVDIHSNTVWAKVSHTTIFAPMARETSEQTSSASAMVWVWYSSIVAVLVGLLIVIPVMMKKKKK